jgi:uncharacterized protein
MVELSEREAIAVGFLRGALPDLLSLYAFGTAGTLGERPESDVDLAFLAESSPSPVEVFRLSQALALRLGRDVDLVDLSSATTVLRAQVVSTGRRLFCSDTPRCEHFEVRVYSAYALLNEERRGILDDIARRGTILDPSR